ncbi:uncharacterized protein GBIM_04721 [Gryllus bimaculatus]|nr:uncharacterized protein GBIM_04721 [Gryllus bimaculatus]
MYNHWYEKISGSALRHICCCRRWGRLDHKVLGLEVVRGREPAANLAGSPAIGDDPRTMLDWEEGDRFSFEDSDRFDGDSLCSWSSEPESVYNNWRGWKRPTLGSGTFGSSKRSTEDQNLARKISGAK